ncbi:TonB-dependent receptor domain-containing protein [Pseudomonas sp. MYb185]|uniref:TonB-dependent receptor domain-containing protein n=1 Tax=Pseudomonas sp. MYb185 TaxID=1848729 RepID=UPI000CFE245D|nr:TonB-dependent receptor [Pseudomonas sp. MYb185]PRB81385.1 TonB-dependent receptor [Pseudomonas sp. MYb185]
MPFKQKKLAIIISTLCLAGPASLALAQDSAEVQGESTTQEESALQLPAMSVRGRYLSQDEQGHNNVYQENVTSVYQGREELQRFQVTNPGDVFKGMNGVYSMDTRSSQAITPNIRGITGEGRTPLTIDGTEQSTNVWLHMFGAGNRSYVDPALFRSIEVEKGPSLSRGIKSGVGGAVNIRTIEASDIIPEGDSWGIEANLKTSGNTSKPRFDAAGVYGQDWRDVPGGQVAGDGATVIVPTPAARTKGGGENLNFDDHSEMLAIAGRNDFMDILISRSERTSGNYYAGKRNADRYFGHDVWDESSTDRYIPNLKKLYGAGSEVFNTASETETTLLKNNLYLPNGQRLGLQFMRTDTVFGETTPGASVLAWGYMEGADKTRPDRDRSQDRYVYEGPHSEQRLDSYKISYDLKPGGSDWLDMETSLWRTKLDGVRYQTGSSPFSIDIDAATQQQLKLWSLMMEYGYYPPGTPPPAHDGTIVPNGRQWTSHDRTGFDLSNQIRLSESLQLTLGGSYQQEKLDDRVQQSRSVTNGIGPDGSQLSAGTDLLGPRSGERKEYTALMNLAWQATDWLSLTAGARYMNYTGKDTGTAKRRRQQDEFYKAQQRLAGLQLEYKEKMTPDQLAEFNRLQQAVIDANNNIDRSDDGNFKIWQLYLEYGDNRPLQPQRLATENPAFRAAAKEYLDFLTANDANQYFQHAGKLHDATEAEGAAIAYLLRVGITGSTFRPVQGDNFIKKVLLPAKDGKFDSSTNPFVSGAVDMSRITIDNPYGSRVYARLGQGRAWEMPEEQSGHAWSPVLGATARVTPFGTMFLRYAQTTRFPSVNELTSGAIIDGAGTVGNMVVNGARKPERSINWEVGYAHDLTEFFPGLGVADARISYYDTQIKDFIDRGLLYDVIQFDQKKSRGVELQSRFDNGRFFGNLSGTYRLEQKLCDKDYASGMDPYYNRIPSCMTGGFPGTYSGNSLQPRYSIDLGLGTRLFNERLELGWRSVYHAGAQNKQLDKLLGSEEGSADYLARDAWFRGGLDTFLWRSVLLHDVYANFNVTQEVALNLGVTNITDEYYLDPMSKNLLPGPGRTVTAGLKINF